MIREIDQYSIICKEHRAARTKHPVKHVDTHTNINKRSLIVVDISFPSLEQPLCPMFNNIFTVLDVKAANSAGWLVKEVLFGLFFFTSLDI